VSDRTGQVWEIHDMVFVVTGSPDLGELGLFHPMVRLFSSDPNEWRIGKPDFVLEQKYSTWNVSHEFTRVT
jgi:hypothetical protein